MIRGEREAQRLDAWLWCARLVRTRARAAALIEEGHVRINRQPTAKPHARLRPGDVLTLPLGRAVRVIAVRALADRRGPVAAALLLYEEIPEAVPTLREERGVGMEGRRDQACEPMENAR